MFETTSLGRDSRTGAKRRQVRILLVSILLVGVFVRVPGLNYCLGMDDLMSLDSFLKRGPSGFLLGQYSSNNHPLASLLSWGTWRVFGEHDWSIKLPSFVFGLASIVLMFVLGKRLFGNEYHGLAAAFLLALQPIHVGYSTAFRGYGAAIFFAMLSALFLYRNLLRPSVLQSAALAFSVFFMGMSHLSFMFLLLCWGIVVVIYCISTLLNRWSPSPHPWRALVLTAVALGVGGLAVAGAYSPSLWIPGEIVHRIARKTWSPHMLAWLSGADNGGISFPFYLWTLFLTGCTGFFFFFAVSVAGVGLLVGWFKQRLGTVICAVVLLMPIVVGAVLNLNLGPRYLLVIVPFFTLSMGAGLVYLASAMNALPLRRVRRPACVAVFVLLTAVWLRGLLPIYSQDYPHGAEGLMSTPGDYKSAANFLRERMAPDDALECSKLVQPVSYYLNRTPTPPRIGTKSAPPERYRLWGLTFETVPQFDSFPEGYAPQKVATFTGCIVWSGEMISPGFHRLALQPMDTVSGRLPTGAPLGWNVTGDSVAEVHTGEAGSTVHVTCTKTSEGLGLMHSAIPIGARKRIVFRADVRGDFDLPKIKLALLSFDARDQPLPWEYLYYPRETILTEAGGVWKRIEFSSFTPLGGHKVSLRLRIEGCVQAGTEVEFRDIELWSEGE